MYGTFEVGLCVVLTRTARGIRGSGSGTVIVVTRFLASSIYCTSCMYGDTYMQSSVICASLKVLPSAPMCGSEVSHAYLTKKKKREANSTKRATLDSCCFLSQRWVSTGDFLVCTTMIAGPSKRRETRACINWFVLGAWSCLLEEFDS